MSTILNTFDCLTGANTGVGSCALDIKFIKGAIIVPSGFSFSAADLATKDSFLAALQLATSTPAATRIFPIHDFAEINDSSENPTEDKLGYGSTLIVRDGRHIWSFPILKGGYCLSKQLRSFNNMNVDVLFIDDNDLVFGIKRGTALYGIPQDQVYQMPLKINDGSKLTRYVQRFSMKSNWVDNGGFAFLNSGDWDLVKGLQNVVLSSGGARVAGVSLVKGQFSCGSADLYATYGSSLAVGSLWSAKDSVSGNVLTITSVALNTNIGGYTVTVDTADPDYVVGHAVIISLAAASVLAAAGLQIESNTFTTPN